MKRSIKVNAVIQMTPEHEAFLTYLEKQAPMTASACRKHWTEGKSYYIDTRVDIKGHRREFNRLNKAVEA